MRPIAICRLCEKASQVKCPRCFTAFCSYHAAESGITCSNCGAPWSMEYDQLDALAGIERAAWSPSQGQGSCARALGEAIRIANRRNCSQEAITAAGRRGTRRRERQALQLAAVASKDYVSYAGGW